MDFSQQNLVGRIARNTDFCQDQCYEYYQDKRCIFEVWWLENMCQVEHFYSVKSINVSQQNSFGGVTVGSCNILITIKTWITKRIVHAYTDFDTDLWIQRFFHYWYYSDHWSWQKSVFLATLPTRFCCEKFIPLVENSRDLTNHFEPSKFAITSLVTVRNTY